MLCEEVKWNVWALLFLYLITESFSILIAEIDISREQLVSKKGEIKKEANWPLEASELIF